MIHGPAIYRRICDLIAQTGAKTKLGLRTLSFGTLDHIPADNQTLVSWLPALMVVMSNIKMGEFRGDSPRGPRYQNYPVDMYLFRRYGGDEVTALTMHEWMAKLELVFTMRDWRDRMLMPDANLQNNAKIVWAQIDEISFDTEAILETRQDLLGQLSAAVLRADVKLLAFSGDITDRKES